LSTEENEEESKENVRELRNEPRRLWVTVEETGKSFLGTDKISDAIERNEADELIEDTGGFEEDT
jgi:hypothetical protein